MDRASRRTQIEVAELLGRPPNSARHRSPAGAPSGTWPPPRPLTARARLQGRFARVAVAAGAVCAVVGVLVAAGVARDDGPPAQDAQAAQREAIQWLDQFGRGQVLADDAMRARLLATRRWDPARLPSVADCRQTPCRPDWLLDTPALRAAQGDGATLGTVPASVPVAVFGSGDERVEIRSTGAWQPLLQAEDARGRTDVGRALAGAARLEVDPPVRELLTAGRVDARVLSLLAALIQRGPLRVTDLPEAPGEDAAGQPRRQALVSSPAGDQEGIRAFVTAQPDPYRPSAATVTPAGVLVVYPPLAPPRLLQASPGS